MAFQSFLANPKTYLRTHTVVLPAGGGLTAAQTAAKVANGGNIHGMHLNVINHPALLQPLAPVPNTLWESIKRSPGNAARRIGARRLGVSQKYIAYRQGPVAGAAGNFATLPWDADTVTYCDVTAAAAAGAEMVFTGPLTGCHVIACKPAGAAAHVYLLHCNANGQPGLATTEAMRDHVINGVLGFPAATTAVHNCRIGHEYHGQAFVIARVRAAGTIKCYVHDVTAGAAVGTLQATTTKWATL